jgi:hypothetical protein
MFRFAPGSVFVAVLAAVAAGSAVSCSKSAGKDAPKVTGTGGPETVAVPGGPGGPGAGGETVAVPGTPKGPGTGATQEGAPPAVDNAFKLKPEEGELSIEVPPDAVAGKETTARVVVTPTAKYKINFEFSTKLQLKPPAEVKVAKEELTAGGQGKEQGDAEKFEEKKLAFAVKLTPTKSGTHTVNGTFKFAVCDKDACLAKREVIAIQLAAK